MLLGDLMPTIHHIFLRAFALLAIVLSFAATPQAATAQTTAFRQAVAEGAARDDVLAEFYRGREFEGISTVTESGLAVGDRLSKMVESRFCL